MVTTPTEILEKAIEILQKKNGGPYPRAKVARELGVDDRYLRSCLRQTSQGRYLFFEDGPELGILGNGYHPDYAPADSLKG